MGKIYSGCKSGLRHVPFIILLIAVIGMALHGPIAHLDHYHEFADQSVWLGIPHAWDVLSNWGFVLVGGWGLWHLRRIEFNWGYCLFIVSICATAFCSSFYHWAPDNARLFWDRLPIALACAGVLAGVRSEFLFPLEVRRSRFEFGVLVAFGIGSVLWWLETADLRPYLLLQGMTLVSIPLYLWSYQASRRDQMWFFFATALYVIAKAVELNDGAILRLTNCISGHSLKHIIAALAAACIVWRIVRKGSKGISDERTTH